MSVSVACADCGVVFCLTDDLYRHRTHDHGNFYCPNGHSNHYPGKTAEEKKIESLEREVRMLEQDYRGLYAQREDLIGVIRECPIPGCGWRSRKLIPRDPVAMGRGIERVRHDLLGHFARDHVGRTSADTQRLLAS